MSQTSTLRQRNREDGAVLAPWESIHVPPGVGGTNDTFRAPRNACTLDANNDYEAVQAWLSLHEAPTTQRAYRKEAERLILWAIVERHRALSSLTTEDAIAYRAFILAPSPRGRWVGPPPPPASCVRLAPVCPQPVGALGGLRTVDAGRPVPLADRAAVCAGQSLCRRQDA